MATKPLEPQLAVDQGGQASAAGDIRAARPFFLSGAPLRMFSRRAASVGSLVFLDLLGLTLGLYATLALQRMVHREPVDWAVLWQISSARLLPFLALLTVVVFALRGLYARRERRGGLGSILGALALVALLAVAYKLGTHQHGTTYAAFPTGVIVCGALIGLFRACYESVTRDLFRKIGVRRRVVLVGEGDSLRTLRAQLGSGRGGIEYAFLGVVAPSDPEVAGLPLLGPLSALPAILASGPVDELVVTDDFKERDLLEIVEQAHRRGLRVRVAPKTTELLVTRGEYTPQEGLPLFELRPPVLIGTDWVIKRGFDLVLSTVVLIVGLPFWLVIALAIKLTSKGPVLYRDRRVGVGEREFAMLKFRTMYGGAAERQAELEEHNEADGPLFKIRDDPRVTSVGRVLRRLSLDEIPQLLNVLKGEMSIVGPRPLPLRDYLQLEDWHRKRYLVLPGITGLWQVAGRIALPFDDLVRLDFYYLENWSIGLDISIIAKTIPAVLAGKGAY